MFPSLPAAGAVHRKAPSAPQQVVMYSLWMLSVPPYRTDSVPATTVCTDWRSRDRQFVLCRVR